MPLCLAAAPERGDGLKAHVRGPDSNGLMSVYRVAIGGWAGLPSVKALQVALLQQPSGDTGPICSVLTGTGPPASTVVVADAAKTATAAAFAEAK